MASQFMSSSSFYSSPNVYQQHPQSPQRKKDYYKPLSVRKALNKAMETRLDSVERTFKELSERVGDPDVVASPQVIYTHCFLITLQKN